MKKKLRVLLIITCLFFSFSSAAFAEVYSLSNNGDPTTPIIWGSEDQTKYICSLTVKVVNISEFGLVVQKGSHGVSNYKVIPSSYHSEEPRINSVKLTDNTVLGFQFTFLDGVPEHENSDVGLVAVNLCDGSSISFSDPFPPTSEGGTDGGTDGGSLPPSNWGEHDTSKPANSCGKPRWNSEIRNWVDDIFCPVITFLDLAKQKLSNVSLMMGQGLNIGQYFSIFGDLPTAWQLVVSSMLLMVATLGGLLIFRSAMRIYYSIKEGVKWW